MCSGRRGNDFGEKLRVEYLVHATTWLMSILIILPYYYAEQFFKQPIVNATLMKVPYNIIYPFPDKNMKSYDPELHRYPLIQFLPLNWFWICKDLLGSNGTVPCILQHHSAPWTIKLPIIIAFVFLFLFLVVIFFLLRNVYKTYMVPLNDKIFNDFKQVTSSCSSNKEFVKEISTQPHPFHLSLKVHQ